MKTTQIASRLAAIAMAALVVIALPAAAEAAAERPSLAAAPLAKGTGYELLRGSRRVRVLQERLRVVGERVGPIDGLFGPLTEGAVMRFQRRQGLAVDGLVGPKTHGALRAAARLLAPGAGYNRPEGSARVRTLQRSLRVVGEHAGPIDGRFGPLTEAAVVHFQRQQGLAADGLAGDATMGALTRAARFAADHPSSPHRNGQPRSTRGANRAPAVDARPAANSGNSGSGVSTEAALALVAGLALGAGAALMLAAVRLRRPVPQGRGAAALGGQGENGGPLAPHSLPVLGYASVPGAANGRHRQELRDQLQAIMAECRRRGLVLVDVVREREPEYAKGLRQPGLRYALGRISQGEARGLVVADLANISRSVTDLGEVLEWFSRTGTRLVAATPGLDTGEQGGRVAASALMDMATWERQRHSERTREGLEAALRDGRRRGRSGVADNPELRERIARMRAEGMTLQAIADRLNQEGVPTIRGGALWRPSSVQAAVGYRRPPRGAPTGAGSELLGKTGGNGR